MQTKQKAWLAAGVLVAAAIGFAAVAQGTGAGVMGTKSEGRPSGTSGATGSAGSSAARSLTTHVALTPEEMKWGPGPAKLPKGITSTLLDGDPKVPDRQFTLQLRLPANTRIMPHYHGTDEHVTVLSGEVGIGMGERFDESALKTIPTRGYFAMPAGHRHFAYSRTGATIQLHGVGPWTITYVNPADDPSRGVGGSGAPQ